MILLDTNVVSALIGEQTDRRVAMWANEKPAEDLWIPTVGLFEVRAGLLRMPPGRRRETLLSNFKSLFEDALGGRSVRSMHSRRTPPPRWTPNARPEASSSDPPTR